MPHLLERGVAKHVAMSADVGSETHVGETRSGEVTASADFIPKRSGVADRQGGGAIYPATLTRVVAQAAHQVVRPEVHGDRLVHRAAGRHISRPHLPARDGGNSDRGNRKHYAHRDRRGFVHRLGESGATSAMRLFTPPKPSSTCCAYGSG